MREELREAGQLNVESGWTKVIHGGRAYYGRGGEWGGYHYVPVDDRWGKQPQELSLELPAEGVKDVRVSGAEDFERHELSLIHI